MLNVLRLKEVNNGLKKNLIMDIENVNMAIWIIINGLKKMLITEKLIVDMKKLICILEKLIMQYKISSEQTGRELNHMRELVTSG